MRILININMCIQKHITYRITASRNDLIYNFIIMNLMKPEIMSCHPVDASFTRLPGCIKNCLLRMKRTENDYIKNISNHHVRHMFILLDWVFDKKGFWELLSTWRQFFTFLWKKGFWAINITVHSSNLYNLHDEKIAGICAARSVFYFVEYIPTHAPSCNSCCLSINNKLPKQVNSISIYMYIDILFL